MHPTMYAARLGLARGWTEFRHSVTNPSDVGGYLLLVAVSVVVLLFQRDARVDGAAVPLAMLTLPGILGLWIGAAAAALAIGGDGKRSSSSWSL